MNRARINVKSRRSCSWWKNEVEKVDGGGGGGGGALSSLSSLENREREGGKRRFARSFLFSPALERTADDVKGNL